MIILPVILPVLDRVTEAAAVAFRVADSVVADLLPVHVEEEIKISISHEN